MNLLLFELSAITRYLVADITDTQIMGCVSERLGKRTASCSKSIRRRTRRKTRGRGAIEYVHTGAGCDVIGKFCDTPGLHQQGAMIRVAIILKFSFLHSVL